MLGALKLATPLVVPILLAAFLAMVSAPLMFWMIRKGVHRYLAVTVALSADIALLRPDGRAGRERTERRSLTPCRATKSACGVLRGQASEWLSLQGLPDLGDLLPARAWTGRSGTVGGHRH